jgi:acyl dehydratase
MAATAEMRHVVSAYNLSAASENKIHDDSVAKRFGFEGGLVPGVEVYAYMTHLAVQTFGADWLRRGAAECRLLKPVYDGREAVATAVPGAHGGIDMQVTMGDVLCATGSARLEDAEPAPPANTLPRAALPAERPEAAPEALRPGTVLGTFEARYSDEEHLAYLHGARETLALYAEQRIVHPGMILRLANRALGSNVRMGPWIHVGSRIRNYATASFGDTLSARAEVLDEYERKGHRFVELDVLAVANDTDTVARIHHTAIYRPRQVTG